MPNTNRSRPAAESHLITIASLLRARTSRDFSHYKPTILRRCIERRMEMQQIGSSDDYVRFLQLASGEADSLYRDLLIGVTSFFRDPQAFKALQEKVIPQLCADRTAGKGVRVWVPACATGEEAYSIAILLQEHIETLTHHVPVTVFATDVDATAIAAARTGLYRPWIAADMHPDRLARFFVPEAGGDAYRIRKQIRDLVVFSEQDLVQDPPVAGLDLVSCRNLLIYLDSDLQKRLLQQFSYAMHPGAFLFLGTSETVGDFGDIFSCVDRKEKIFRRKENPHYA